MKNYQETRAKEIRAEAEKRAFAIQTNQEHIVKKAFERLTKRLDAQEEIIRQSDECIESLKLQLTLCTKGEEWKINREIKKHQKVIDLAEARIEDEEDKEELIRKETKSLLEVYRNNRSLFRSVSEPNLFQGNIETTEEKPIAFEEWDHRDSAQKEEETPSKASSGRQMDSNHQSQECEYKYNKNGGQTIVKNYEYRKSRLKLIILFQQGLFRVLEEMSGQHWNIPVILCGKSQLVTVLGGI